MLPDLEIRPQRTRIGIISPDDGVNDDEYWGYLPAGVTLLWTRYRTPQRFAPISVDMVGSYGDMSLVVEAAETLRITRPQCMVFCCNSCSFVHGPEADQAIRDRMTNVCGCAATSVTHAQVYALQCLGVRRVALGAPYVPDVTAKLEAYLLGCGIQVVTSRSLALTSEWQIGNTPPQVWYDLCLSIDSPAAEAILLACSGIRTREIHDRVERRCQKPLVSAPAVTVWHSLRLAGVTTQKSKCGVLLEKH